MKNTKSMLLHQILDFSLNYISIGQRISVKSKEDLDKELDQYMDNSKSSMNAELGI